MTADAIGEGERSTPQANVRISRVTIRGFRCIDNLTIDLEPDTTYLVGENNTGKTSILMAISAALGRSRPSDDDLARRSDGTTIGTATVDLQIVPSSGNNFGTYERGALGANVHRAADQPVESACIRSEFSPSREGGHLLVNRTFMQPGRQGELVASKTPFLASSLSIFECELLDASRDLVADLGTKTSRWGRVLFDLQIPDLPDKNGVPDPLGRSALEAALGSLAADMRQASPVLTQLEKDLGRMSRVQNTVGDVSLLPFPPKIEEVMRSVDILLSHDGAPSLPLRFHGLGSRSLAALFVFSTLCSLRVGADQGLRPHFMTLVEEPESHLHPQAITALRLELDALPGQTVVTTHSTQLVCEAPPKSLRVLRRSAASFAIYRLGAAALAETARFRRFVERPFGEFFFSRLVIFGDGAAERDALPVLLHEVLGVSPAALGVTIVDCESMDHPQIPKLVAAAEELGLPWIVFADNDESGIHAVNQIINPETGVRLDFTSPRVVLAGAKAMEKMLMDAGYGDEVAAIAAEHGDSAISAAAQMGYLKSHKGWIGEAVSNLALKNGKPVPPPVIDLAGRISQVLGLKPVADSPGTGL